MTVIGLGNPGPRYHHTRHNAGFLVLDRLAGELGICFKKPFLRKYLIARGKMGDSPVFLIKPLTFMNRSGAVLSQVLKKTGESLEELLVVCDNMDLPPGSCRLKLKGSSGGQKGLESIIRQAGTNAFKRLYLGIGKPAPGSSVIDHVLGTPAGTERDAFYQGIELAAGGILRLESESPEKIMSLLNRKIS